MPVPVSFADLSTTPASNSPPGSESPGLTDDYFRTIFAMLRAISLNSGMGWTPAYLPLTGGSMSGAIERSLSGDLTIGATNAAGNVVVATAGVGRLRIDEFGRMLAALHNSAAPNSPAAAPEVCRSGTYTPTVTAVVNCSLAGSTVAQWMRVGNVVTVSGTTAISFSAGGTAKFRISLPVPSNFTIPEQCGGAGVGDLDFSTGSPGYAIRGDVANDDAEFVVSAPSASVGRSRFSFTYVVA